MSEAKQQTAVVTGAGSGVGRAVAVALAGRGWTVAVLGRRKEPLDETASLAKGGRVVPISCDVGDAEAVKAMAEQVRSELGDPSVLVNAAGTNLPERELTRLTTDAWRDLLSANLDGAFHTVHAFLPGMRAAGRGTIVNVNSVAGLRGNSGSGAAYCASKFGMTGLTEAINAEENAHGIRACNVCPGDIDTPLLQKRPSVPDADRRTRMLQPEDVAACVLLAIDLPDRAVVDELVVRPRVST